MIKKMMAVVALTSTITIAFAAPEANKPVAPAPGTGGQVGQGFNTPSNTMQSTQQQLNRAADQARQAADDAMNRARSITPNGAQGGQNNNLTPSTPNDNSAINRDNAIGNTTGSQTTN